MSADSLLSIRNLSLVKAVVFDIIDFAC